MGQQVWAGTILDRLECVVPLPLSQMLVANLSVNMLWDFGKLISDLWISVFLYKNKIWHSVSLGGFPWVCNTLYSLLQWDSKDWNVPRSRDNNNNNNDNNNNKHSGSFTSYVFTSFCYSAIFISAFTWMFEKHQWIKITKQQKTLINKSH